MVKEGGDIVAELATINERCRRLLDERDQLRTRLRVQREAAVAYTTKAREIDTIAAGNTVEYPIRFREAPS